MARAGVDLKINYLDVQDYVGGVVDCKIGRAEFLEFVMFGRTVVEG
jgi:hypothetical protein